MTDDLVVRLADLVEVSLDPQFQVSLNTVHRVSRDCYVFNTLLCVPQLSLCSLPGYYDALSPPGRQYPSTVRSAMVLLSVLLTLPFRAAVLRFPS